MKAVGYCRVSTENQAHEGTIELQEREIQEFCREKGFELIRIFKDEGIPGTKNLENRPGLKELFDFVEENEVDYIIVWKLDRLARDLFLQEFLINKLEALKVKLISIKEPGILEDERDPLRRAFRQFLGIIAELERTFITLRLQGGRINKLKVKSGFPGGRPALGYKTQERELIVDEEKVALVKLIFNLRKEGKSLQEIANFLNANNILSPSGRRWKKQTVHYILKNRIYQGYLKLKDLEAFREDLQLFAKGGRQKTF